ncbi:hypothetical protein [Microbulbifer sediminum]|uniref:hypothetical protein n=1 Tax=Microbulbifer sediminum TaxID=2904250 RepID=UPI001F2A6578|nr:hypothetical protein [Microbulbifer sediminum]
MKQIWLALAFILLPLVGFAQDQEPQGGDTATPAEEQDAANVRARAPDSNSKESDVDNYEASEEISEDLSVSYPIDI